MQSLPSGGGFLLAPCGATRIGTTDDFTEEQREFYKVAHNFMVQRVVPQADKIEHKDNKLLRALIREAGELGLLSIDIPEAFGGLAQDETTSMLIGEAMAKNGSWSVTFGGHVGIGTLPIVFFG